MTKLANLDTLVRIVRGSVCTAMIGERALDTVGRGSRVIVDQFYLSCLSQASYLLADEDAGEAIVIDPRRDVDEYVDRASQRGVRIIGVVNTHFHADFVSGHFELQELTGAWIGLGARARAEYPFRPLAHGQRLSLGSTLLEILGTPGHTWESISILAKDPRGGSVVFSGDTLFVGDVGRPDLAAAVGADPEELAHAQFRSLHETLLTLPLETVVYPAHGAGSACGRRLSRERQSTIGKEAATNPALQLDEEAFVADLLVGQPPAPAYFAEDAVLNRRRRPALLAPPDPRPVGADEVDRLDAAGVRILDSRSPDDFAAGHLERSINVGLDGRFAETAGMFFSPGEQVLIVAPAGRANETALRLRRIGIDDPIGYVENLESLLTIRGVASARITPRAFNEVRAELDPIVVDVRSPAEFDDGAIPGATSIPLAHLPVRADYLPEGRLVVVHCASGWRSSVAASYLRTRGREVRDLHSGYGAWRESALVAEG
ncbi:MBL fold metallo-hydrolase [Microbacterium enclense]|uniref:MBL fold metallo-hydrolase n=1 Tax=Microbacterium enclense TaxID=993073 RepID=UPI003F81DDDB